jgi:hypothetical protein
VKGEERSERLITSGSERGREKWVINHLWKCKGKTELVYQLPLGVGGEERSGQSIGSRSNSGREKWTTDYL